MNLEILLSDVECAKEIMIIFTNIQPKLENINCLWKTLNEHKAQLLKMKENDDIIKKLRDVYKIASFVEEMLLNSVQSVEYDVETGEIFDPSIPSKEFIDDWAHFSEILRLLCNLCIFVLQSTSLD